MSTAFRNLADLATLPYFRIDDGRLVLRDKSIGPVIDMHMHVALAYLAPNHVNYESLAPETKHYLPACCAIDFDVYQNENIPAVDIEALKSDLTMGSFRQGGMRATHTAANLLREMNELGIERTALLAIDFPVISKNYEVAASRTSDPAFKADADRLLAKYPDFGTPAGRAAVRATIHQEIKANAKQAFLAGCDVVLTMDSREAPGVAEAIAELIAERPDLKPRLDQAAARMMLATIKATPGSENLAPASAPAPRGWTPS